MPPLLDVRNLSVDCVGDGSVAKRLVNEVSFSVEEDSSTAIIGRSGSGKSLICSAVAGLLGRGLEASGEMVFRGRIVALDPARDPERLGRVGMGYVPQETSNALSPVFPVGRQLIDAARANGAPDRRSAEAMVIATLERLDIADPARRIADMPSSFSGGERQRLLLAMALLVRPVLLIADEPTSALDVLTQQILLDVLDRVRREDGLALLFVTHDVRTVRERADRVLVIDDGRLVEAGATAAVLTRPGHAATRELIDAAGVGA